uniref:Uncharacterized protein n=1 Tax=Panagrolaimus sp. JU765 TaxID=591449 RepID=A0AC34QFH6_9BILA
MTSLYQQFLKMSPLEPQNVASSSRPPKLFPMNEGGASTSNSAPNQPPTTKSATVIPDDDDMPPVLDRVVPIPESHIQSSRPSTSSSQYFPSLINPKPLYHPLYFPNLQPLDTNSLLFLQQFSTLYSNLPKLDLNKLPQFNSSTPTPKTESLRKQSPSISIEIKETPNSFLENLMAKHGSENKDEKTEKELENAKLKGPETDKQIDDDVSFDNNTFGAQNASRSFWKLFLGDI